MRRTLLALLGAVVSAVAIGILVASIDVGAALGVLSRTSPVAVIGALAVVAVQLALRAVRWRTILPDTLTGRPISARRLISPLLVGYLANAVLPSRLGEPIRAALVTRRERIPLAESLASVLLERIADVATLAPVALVAAGLVGAPAWVVQIAGVAAVVSIGVLTVLFTVGVGPLVAVARRFPPLGNSCRLVTVMEEIARFAAALGGAHRRQVILAAAGVSLVAWLLDGTIFWLAARALGIDLTPPAAMLVSAIAVLGTAVPSAPGYLGTFELAAASVGRALGVPGDEALALAILAHALGLLALAFGGAIALVAMGSSLTAVAAAAEPHGVRRSDG